MHSSDIKKESGGLLFNETPDAHRSLLESIVDLYGILDSEGRVLDIAGRIFLETNIDPAMLTGQPFAETVFWQSSKNTSIILDNALSNAKTGIPQTITIDFRVRSDKRIPLELHIRPTTLPSDTNVLIISAERHQANDRTINDTGDETDVLLLAAENSEIGLWYRQLGDEQIVATPTAKELLGLPRYEPLTISGFAAVVHPDDITFVTKFFEKAAREFSKYQEEFRVVYPNGDVEWICVEGRTFPAAEGKPARQVGIVKKITEQKNAAEEVAKIHDREKKARDEAIEANRAKDFFLAFVSHELRAPLNAILGWSKILLTKQVDDDTRRSALETIERSARIQTKLMNDLVDSARVASGKLRLEYRPTDLYELVRGCVQAQEPAANAKEVTLEFAANRTDVVIFGDVNRLQQVFSNLISNAIKFTPQGGNVAVSIISGKSHARIYIEDTGQGISSDSLPNIFRQFSQGEPSDSRNSSGLGLGLSIAKILAERHGGSVTAESDGAGHGSKFTVTLPLTSSATEVAEKAANTPLNNGRPLEGFRILIIEDDSDSREVLQLFLEQNGASVVSAPNARTGFTTLTEMRGHLPNLIVSDLAMPDEDGYSLMTRIRELVPAEGGQVPSIALSAFATNESMDRAFKAGFNKYLTKPFEPDTLVSEIADLLSRVTAA
ncbi:MAG: response regulator [Acidobacteria bacterium]|nr:response regulator [Acidobacteriota bacterium]